MTEALGPGPLVVFAKHTPYLVIGVTDCRDAEGRPVAMQPVTALCRCGHSARQPYCDGTHSRIGFVGEKGTPRHRDRVRDVVGREITIHDNRGLCAHDGACVGGLPAVFRRGRIHWIDPDGASPEQIMATIEKCPSGALGYTCRGKRGPQEGRPPAIRIVKNGPYRLQGGIRIIGDLASATQPGERCALCRCGQARNKPFCDGSHEEAPFES